MGGQSGSIGSLVLGAALIVVGAITENPFLIVGGSLMLIGGAVGLAFPPKSAGLSQAQSQQIQLSTAATGYPIPIIFGEQKIVGNYLNFDIANFRADPVSSSSSSGGKGGAASSSQVTGFNYYFCFEYGICMGPIDTIQQAWSSPGEFPMDVTVDPSGIGFIGDYIEMQFDANNEVGPVRIYQGNATQTRVPGGDPYYGNGMNYRNVCWALFGPGGGFRIGSAPQPKTYSFIVRRNPKCVRDDGTPVPGFVTNGSTDPMSNMYFQANPAAIIYEMYTNKLWGRGLSSDLFDEASFVDASIYFAGKNIGMSWTIDTSDSITNMVDNIRQHLKTIVVWDGGKLKLRVLTNLDDTHGAIQTLTASMVAALQVSRPDWNNTTNQVTAEFNNRTRNYRPDTVTVQDLANLQVVGGIVNPQRIQLSGFTDYNITRQQAYRILLEMSYPFMTATFEMNRFKSQLEIGDVFRLIWKNWTQNVVTAYFMVLKIEEGDSEDDNIKVTALEDATFCPVEGEETAIDIPTIQRWETLPDIPEGDVDLYVATGTNQSPITPATAIELPAILVSGAVARVIVLGEAPTSAIETMQVFVGQLVGFAGVPPDLTAEPAFTLIGQQSTFAICGTLITTINDSNYFDRTDAGFEFSLANFAKDETIMLGAATKVSAITDDLEQLLLQKTDFMFIGEEILQVGVIEKLGANHYRARNFLRGRFGTDVVIHPAGQRTYYTQTFPASYDASVFSYPGGSANITVFGGTGAAAFYTKFQIYPVGTGGVVQVSNEMFVYHEGANNQQFLGTSVSPLSPSLVSYNPGTGTVTIRPRFFDKGTETGAFFAILGQLIGTIDQTAHVIFLDATGAPIANFYPATTGPLGQQIPGFSTSLFNIPMTFIPGTLSDPNSGVATFSLLVDTAFSGPQIPAGAVQAIIYANLNGKQSIDFVSVNL